MNKEKNVFAQLVEHLDYFKFRRLVEKHQGDTYDTTYQNGVDRIARHFPKYKICGLSLLPQPHSKTISYTIFNTQSSHNFKD